MYTTHHIFIFTISYFSSIFSAQPDYAFTDKIFPANTNSPSIAAFLAATAVYCLDCNCCCRLWSLLLLRYRYPEGDVIVSQIYASASVSLSYTHHFCLHNKQTMKQRGPTWRTVLNVEEWTLKTGRDGGREGRDGGDAGAGGGR
ncbi:hypothetical protein Hanom_Chr07g00680791 [Helianthus anomalus]